RTGQYPRLHRISQNAAGKRPNDRGAGGGRNETAQRAGNQAGSINRLLSRIALKQGNIVMSRNVCRQIAAMTALVMFVGCQTEIKSSGAAKADAPKRRADASAVVQG